MTNKIIGSIPYGLGTRLANPGDAESEKLIYAFAQNRETISLRMLATHIREHGSPYSVGMLYGVLTDMVFCTQELLKSGYNVDFEGLARFYITLKGEGVKVAEDFNPAAHITKVNVRADIEPEAVEFMNSKPEFEYVTTREEQAEAKRAAKAALTAEVGGNTTDPDGGDNGGNNSGSGSGGSDDSGVTE